MTGATLTAPPVRAAAAADAERVVAVLTLAFSADPVARWSYPDPQQYRTFWPEFVRAFGGLAFEHGTAFYTDGYAGAALWLPPGVHADEDALGALLERSIAPQDQAGVYAVLEQMGAYHPAGPHWYLPADRRGSAPPGPRVRLGPARVWARAL